MRGARGETGANRHVLYLSQEQMESVAYGLWLHKVSGSAIEANRFSRDYGITHHQPAPAAGSAWPRNGVGRSVCVSRAHGRGQETLAPSSPPLALWGVTHFRVMDRTVPGWRGLANLGVRPIPSRGRELLPRQPRGPSA
ncbi:DUF6417 family protein [Streptomyces sp. NPDC012616]|uniref:DUF6417 family protein n=1 Tax=Streptomyces sp. NPDC012616 TaxID=3364840 RepID=UPI0036E4C6F6